MKHIHLIAPSGAKLDANKPLMGIHTLKSLGFQIHHVQCIDRVNQRFAGTDEERLSDLNQLAILDPKNVVMVMRGGYGLHRLLPDIAWQAIATNIQKGLQICGHSDFSAFQLAMLAKTGAITLAGPMLNFDFANQNEQGDALPPNVFMWKHFQAAIDHRVLDCNIIAPQFYLGQASEGIASGILWGGNLTVLTSLVGTPYLPNLQQTTDGVLFLEDVNEHPYRIERMLIQLLDAGILSNQSAILLGGFSGYRLYENDQGYNLDCAVEIIRKRIPSHIPVITGLPFGHQLEKLTLPVGALAHIRYDQKGFTIGSRW